MDRRLSLKPVSWLAILFIVQRTVARSKMSVDSECYTANGADYVGTQATTYVPGSGAYEPTYPNIEDCLPWNEQSLPFNVTNITKTLPGNYCRNPNNRLFPYCYVMRDGAPTFAYCHIPTCSTPALIGCFKLYVRGTPATKGRENVTTTGPPPDLILDGEDSKVNDDEMRIARCLNFCRSKDYDYAGVTGGDSCMCGKEREDGRQMDDVLNHLHPHDCLQYSCSGDVMQACGGDNAIAIYDVEAGSCDPHPVHDRDRGVIYSPRWPGNYHNEASCQWTVYVPDRFRKDKETMDNHRMHLYFSYFNLEKKNDTLKIYTYANQTDTNSVLVATYSGGGQQVPAEILLEVSKVFAVHMVFKSDKDGKHDGFILHFNITNIAGEMETTLPDVVVTETTTTKGTTRSITTKSTTTRRTTTNPSTVSSQTTSSTTTDKSLSRTSSTTTATTTTVKSTTASNVTTVAVLEKQASNNAGKIAGIVLGVLLAVVLIVLGVLIFIRHRRSQADKEDTTPKPPAMFNNPVTFNSDTTL